MGELAVRKTLVAVGLLLAIPPPTATKTADKDVPDGTLTVQQAAKVFDDPAAGVARLTAAGYQRGAEVQWLEADGSAFAPAVEISGVPGGAVYARTTISSNNRWFTEAVFTRHDISVELFVTGPKKLGPEKTIALAQAQYALLP
jgi:hypothetical protein